MKLLKWRRDVPRVPAGPVAKVEAGGGNHLFDRHNILDPVLLFFLEPLKYAQ
jgi:hypothetical protein